MGTLSPQAEAFIKAREAERHAYLHDKGPLFDSRLGARSIGDMALIGEGFTVWAKRDGEHMRLAHDGEARGGIVLEVTDVAEWDEETGEVAVRRRAFRCYNPYIGGPDDYRAYSVLTEAEVDLSACAAPDLATLRRAYRRMAKAVGARNGTAPLDEIELMTYGGRLAAIVGQQRGQ